MNGCAALHDGGSALRSQERPSETLRERCEEDQSHWTLTQLNILATRRSYLAQLGWGDIHGYF